MDNILTTDIGELIEFLYRSKQKCFASTEEKTSLTNETSIYSNRELPWCYTDTYWGNTIERGVEDVSFNLIPVWSMQYRGGYYQDYWDISEDLSKILKLALKNLPKDFPIRGPREFELAEYVINGETITADVKYVNNWEGDLIRFKGEEHIYIDGKEVFYHDYIGGVNRNKHYPVLVKLY